METRVYTSVHACTPASWCTRVHTNLAFALQHLHQNIQLQKIEIELCRSVLDTTRWRTNHIDKCEELPSATKRVPDGECVAELFLRDGLEDGGLVGLDPDVDHQAEAVE